MKKLLSLLFLFVLTFLSLSANVSGEGIGLSPAIQELSIGENDQTSSFEINVSNQTNQSVVLGISTLDFGALDESGGIAFIGRNSQTTTNYGLSDWMKPEVDSVNLGPNQNREVKIEITNNAGLRPGGHYGAVVVTALNSGEPGNSLAIQPAGSTLVLLQKSGGIIKDLKLSRIITNKSLIRLPNELAFTFLNEGNVHVAPRGTVSLYGPTGKLISKGTINQQSSFVLPESSRQFKINLGNVSQPWLLGRYRLQIDWRYDGKQESEQTIIYAWYIGKLAIITIILLCLLTVLILFIRWRRNPVIRG